MAGGLSTSLATLRANLFLSAAVALIGIAAPIALSFILQEMAGATALQAFAAGAALCSTSLGTTFTVLATSGLTESRLGVVLSSAAMMDDVVGLVMVKVISELGPRSAFDAVTIARPVLVSVAFAVVAPLVCWLVVKPVTLHCLGSRTGEQGVKGGMLKSSRVLLVVHTAVLLAMVTGATYAGTSNLFAAYLAGVVMAWWSELLDCKQEQSVPRERPAEEKPVQDGGSHAKPAIPQSPVEPIHAAPAAPAPGAPAIAKNMERPREQEEAIADLSGLAIFEKYYASALKFVLKPFFFASIGLSIPISRMFNGTVVWRGVVYAILMGLSKLLCGLWLLRFTGLPDVSKAAKKMLPSSISGCWPFSTSRRDCPHNRTPASSTPSAGQGANSETQPRSASKRSPKPLSLYPAAILGSAMVARGEIGFLISAVAESQGIFRQEAAGGGADLFLIVTWAILICTIAGPIVVGLLVRRVKALQQEERNQRTGNADPLGIWGVLPGQNIPTAGPDRGGSG